MSLPMSLRSHHDILAAGSPMTSVRGTTGRDSCAARELVAEVFDSSRCQSHWIHSIRSRQISSAAIVRVVAREDIDILRSRD